MKILFITSNRLGDGVLSTGALDYLLKKYPGAQVTVACGPLVAGIFAAVPGVTNVIPLKKQRMSGHWLKLWQETVGTRWDIIVDLRNSLVSRLLRGDKKYIWCKPDNKLHKVQQIASLIGADVTTPPAPRLWFDAATLAQAEKLVPKGSPVIAVGPAANWPAKTWPAENFNALIARLTAQDGSLPNARIAVFAAPGEEETARKVLNAVPIERRIDGIGWTSPLLAAAAIQRCDLYIGNDSGLMHCAAAVGTKTLGLFGPSRPEHYRPWGPHCAYVSTPKTFDELIDYPGYDPKTAPCLMTSLTVDMAESAAKQLPKI